MIVTKEHLDEAAKHPWSLETCLIQQAVGGKLYNENNYYAFKNPDKKEIEKMEELIEKFDDCFRGETAVPERVAILRELLPVELNLEF